MKATTLMLALALATATSGAFAAEMARESDNGSMAAPAQNDGSQGLNWVRQNEAQKARLEREGFPQYTN